MGTKNNPGPFDCYAKADPDEPIFVLRAKDPLAPALVRLWAHVRRVYDQAKGTVIVDKYREAIQCADQMENWREKQLQRATFIDQNILLCVCGHAKIEHNILQDYAGPGLPAHPVEYRHCKECKCPVFQRPNM